MFFGHYLMEKKNIGSEVDKTADRTVLYILVWLRHTGVYNTVMGH